MLRPAEPGWWPGGTGAGGGTGWYQGWWWYWARPRFRGAHHSQTQDLPAPPHPPRPRCAPGDAGDAGLPGRRCQAASGLRPQQAGGGDDAPSVQGGSTRNGWGVGGGWQHPQRCSKWPTGDHDTCDGWGVGGSTSRDAPSGGRGPCGSSPTHSYPTLTRLLCLPLQPVPLSSAPLHAPHPTLTTRPLLAHRLPTRRWTSRLGGPPPTPRP